MQITQETAERHTLAVIVEASRHVGATPAQTSSWVTVLCLGMAVTSGFLSVRYRMPIVTAWSLAGAVLIAAAPAVPVTSWRPAPGASCSATTAIDSAGPMRGCTTIRTSRS